MEGFLRGHGTSDYAATMQEAAVHQTISLLSLAPDFSALAAPNAPLDGITSHCCSGQLLHF